MQHPNFTRRSSAFTWELENPEVVVLDYDDRDSLCEVYQPRLVGKFGDYAQLNEISYKELAAGIDKDFLNQRVRADALDAPQLVGFQNNIMNWRVRSSEFTQNRIVYLDSVLFEEWDEIGQDPNMNFNEKARLALWASNIKLHCTCPSYLYWGYQYILTVLDAAIYPETRFPKIRNPRERGIFCKHLNKVFQVLPFYLGDIAKEFRRQFGA